MKGAESKPDQKQVSLRIALIALAMLLASLPSSAFARQSASPADERRAFAENILASVNLEWNRYFVSRGRAYEAPKGVVMRLPNGHPARGFGYDRSLINIDLSDMIDHQKSQPTSADLITALVIAHEVAHHAQHVIANMREFRRHASTDRELEREADCAAGWWLGKANARHLNATGKPFLVAQDLADELPRALKLLFGSTSDGGSNGVETHGNVEERVSAIELGMRSPHIKGCGGGFNL